MGIKDRPEAFPILILIYNMLLFSFSYLLYFFLSLLYSYTYAALKPRTLTFDLSKQHGYNCPLYYRIDFTVLFSDLVILGNVCLFWIDGPLTSDGQPLCWGGQPSLKKLITSTAISTRSPLTTSTVSSWILLYPLHPELCFDTNLSLCWSTLFLAYTWVISCSFMMYWTSASL